jgi:hypothetical protein
MTQIVGDRTTEAVLSRTARVHSQTFNNLVDVSILIRPISKHYTSVAKSVSIRVRGEVLAIEWHKLYLGSEVVTTPPPPHPPMFFS